MKETAAYFKSICDQDSASVVICDTDHRVIYMNRAAVGNYAKYGGENIVGRSIFECHNEESCEMIRRVVQWFALSAENNRVHTYFNAKENKDVYMIALRDQSGQLIGYYEKHEYRNRDLSPFYEMS